MDCVRAHPLGLHRFLLLRLAQMAPVDSALAFVVPGRSAASLSRFRRPRTPPLRSVSPSSLRIDFADSAACLWPLRRRDQHYLRRGHRRSTEFVRTVAASSSSSLSRVSRPGRSLPASSIQVSIPNLWMPMRQVRQNLMPHLDALAAAHRSLQPLLWCHRPTAGTPWRLRPCWLPESAHAHPLSTGAGPAALCQPAAPLLALRAVNCQGHR